MFDYLSKKFSITRIKRKLNDDLNEAKFSNDWEKRQSASLKLLWIKFLEEENMIISQSLGIVRRLEQNIRNGDDSYLPNPFDKEDLLHDKFAEKIVQDYGGSVANSGKYSSCFYRPASQLPYPKDYINKAINHVIDVMQSPDPSWKQPVNATEILGNIKALQAFLPNYVNVNESELPSTMPDNVSVAQQLLKK